MKVSLSLLSLILCLNLFSQSGEQTVPVTQTDSLTSSTKNVSDSSNVSKPTQLLPNHYLLTQRILWGEKGLMRNIHGFELNEANRNKEIKIRNVMLTTHRILGYAALAGMAGQAFTGIQIYNGHDQYKGLHEGLAGFTSITYFGSAGMMLFAPPWKSDRAPGYSNTKLHKYLAMTHLAAMITTLATAGGAEHPGTVRDIHRGAAIGAFGSLFVSTIVINL